VERERGIGHTKRFGNLACGQARRPRLHQQAERSEAMLLRKGRQLASMGRMSRRGIAGKREPEFTAKFGTGFASAPAQIGGTTRSK